MNNYLKQLIEKYEQKTLWDIRARSGQKAMIMPLIEWLDIINHPLENNCFAAYRTSSEHKIQGLITQDKRFFISEGTARYQNICEQDKSFTFILISDMNSLFDSAGYSEEYLQVRSRVAEGKRNVFSSNHTFLTYKILRTFKNFNDITNYSDFINRYTGELGEKLCKQKGVNRALAVQLNKILKDENDFNQLEWTLFEEDEKHNLFYHDSNNKYTTRFSKIWLDGGVYEQEV